jgi:hypothetical protein
LKVEGRVHDKVKGKDVAGPAELVGTVTVDLLPAGENMAVEFTWTPAEAGRSPPPLTPVG